MNAVLAFVTANSSYFSIGALIMSVFFAGTMLKGEMVRKNEIKDQLAALRELNKATIETVEQINSELSEKDAQIVEQINERYAEIAVLDQQGAKAKRSIQTSTVLVKAVEEKQEKVVEEIEERRGLRLRPRPPKNQN